MRSFVLVLFAACAVDVVEPPAVARRPPTCPTYGCGTNAATIGDGVVFDELDATGGEPNVRGVRILSVEAPDGTPARVVVEGDELLVEHADGTRVSGLALQGLRLTLDGGDGETFDLELQAVSPEALQFWAPPTLPITSYEFVVTRIGKQMVKAYICKQDIAATESAWEGVEHSAIVFTGDRYDAERKLVLPGVEPDSRWFNLACAGTASAKQHLLRHTQAGSDAAHVTSIDERQALLKMLTADYCGTGESYTIDGQPLAYGDRQDFYPDGGFEPARAGPVEALWTAAGAICLNEPRRGLRKNVACDLPRCSDDQVKYWRDHAQVISALP